MLKANAAIRPYAVSINRNFFLVEDVREAPNLDLEVPST